MGTKAKIKLSQKPINQPLKIGDIIYHPNSKDDNPFIVMVAKVKKENNVHTIHFTVLLPGNSITYVGVVSAFYDHMVTPIRKFYGEITLLSE